MTDLLILTVYLAVTAWLISLNQPSLIPIWLGTVFGLESGKRSDYPTVLIMICGTVCGLAFTIAMQGTFNAMQPRPLIPFGADAFMWLTIVAWLTFLSIFFWILFRVGRRPANKGMADNLNKPSDEGFNDGP